MKVAPFSSGDGRFAQSSREILALAKNLHDVRLGRFNVELTGGDADLIIEAFFQLIHVSGNGDRQFGVLSDGEPGVAPARDEPAFIFPDADAQNIEPIVDKSTCLIDEPGTHETPESKIQLKVSKNLIWGTLLHHQNSYVMPEKILELFF